MSLAEYWRTLRTIIDHPVNKHRKFDAIGDYLRWNIGKRLLRSDYLLPLAGDASIILSDRQNYATLAYTCRLWDFPEMMFLLHVLRPGDTFLDIGANVGGYAVLASATAGANVIAFEPVPGTFFELERNIALNNVAGLVEARRVCVGAHHGSIKMTADRGGLNHVATELDEATRLVETELVCLDDTLAGTPCQLIKIDAEGFETEILAGAEATLRGTQPFGLIVEINGTGLRYGHSDQSVHDRILGFGFEPYDYEPSRRELRRRATFNSDGFNTLYLRGMDGIQTRLATAPPVAVGGLRI